MDTGAATTAVAEVETTSTTVEATTSSTTEAPPPPDAIRQRDVDELAVPICEPAEERPHGYHDLTGNGFEDLWVQDDCHEGGQIIDTTIRAWLYSPDGLVDVVLFDTTDGGSYGRGATRVTDVSRGRLDLERSAWPFFVALHDDGTVESGPSVPLPLSATTAVLEAMDAAANGDLERFSLFYRPSDPADQQWLEADMGELASADPRSLHCDDAQHYCEFTVEGFPYLALTRASAGAEAWSGLFFVDFVRPVEGGPGEW